MSNVENSYDLQPYIAILNYAKVSSSAWSKLAFTGASYGSWLYKVWSFCGRTSELPRVSLHSSGRSCDDESIGEEELSGTRRLFDAHVWSQSMGAGKTHIQYTHTGVHRVKLAGDKTEIDSRQWADTRVKLKYNKINK